MFLTYLLSFSSDADRAPQLKASVSWRIIKPGDNEAYAHLSVLAFALDVCCYAALSTRQDTTYNHNGALYKTGGT